MTLDELRSEVADGAIDTVLLVMTDMQGRLMGKRLHAPFFMSDIADHGAEGCYYLLTVDVDMTPVQGFEMASWDTGYGDFVFRPDMATIRRLPWLPGTALVIADLEWQDGRRSWRRPGRCCAASSTGWPSAGGRPTSDPSSSSCCSATATTRPAPSATTT